ncbi:baseplate J/gp47 family protein [Photobacterium galatheae]|uniref:Baseplate assembly protein n=1 Tax=Photobacterium galatheae TaxID=1654360 RepID=A0A066RVH9_9GAMM|nr:baseplate J/gp47 family protein [Photobacterium galatheae]KDM91398.1 baseplate assembly protein [Photobacterium galatheae]MCM0151657.1 baseplate J/gp47 family protein [Photobacterium galatheae]
MSQIDLSKLPPPEIVQQLDATAIRSRMLQRYAQLQNVDAPKVGDPLYNAMSAMAEEVTRARQEFQDISLNNMVAFSHGASLQQLAALRPVEKFEKETDDQFRRRVQMAPDGFSTAGPDGAYIFHALNAHEDVLDAEVLSPSPVKVDLYVLSRQGDGTASAELCQQVFEYIDGQTKRPLNDHFNVYPATIKPYRIVVELDIPYGPGEGQTLDIARQRLQSLATESHVLAGCVALSAIDAAAHVKNGEADGSYQPVTEVFILEPAQTIKCTKAQAPYCTDIIVRLKGT